MIRWYSMEQHRPCNRLDDVEKAVREAVAQLSPLPKWENQTVGIAVGSRGISNLPNIIHTLVQLVKEGGGTPVLFAAMGSHGCGTAQGQREVLASLGITEESMEAEIRTCAETVSFGRASSGVEVFGNPLALEFDQVILCNRVKMHTDFSDVTESGLLKLMAIGIGNPTGAAQVHRIALQKGYGAAIREAAEVHMAKLPIAFGVAIAENWKHETETIRAFLPGNLLAGEKQLLSEVKAKAVKLPVDELDTLLIWEAGKNISGTCVDTKVIGRLGMAGQPDPPTPNIKTIAALRFTEVSHGNAMGMGVVDLITRKFFDQIRLEDTGLTGMTSNCLLQAKIPCVAPTDQLAIETAIRASGVEKEEDAKAAFIENTNALARIAVSEPVYEAMKGREDITCLGGPFTLTFDGAGNLKTNWLGEEIKE